MTAEDFLVKAGAKDWRSLNKSQIVSAANFLLDTRNNMSNEARIKILETAPEILNAAYAIFLDIKDIAKEVLESNTEITNNILENNHDVSSALFKSYHMEQEMFQKLIENPDTPFDQKKYWYEKLFESRKEQLEYDEKNKEFLKCLDKENKLINEKVLRYGLLASSVLFSVAITALVGGNLKIPSKL
ncbi:MAG: hypothetical protein FWE02_05505 [Defluviitaleaceae bacterium]|nr:hypothetical protein [Defluviitaleaceae bacterium]